MGTLGSIDYSIIGLLFLLLNAVTALAKMTLKSHQTPQSTLLEDERNALLTLYHMHKVVDPKTNVPIWYNPPQYFDAITESTKSLGAISIQLERLVEKMDDKKATDQKFNETMIRRVGKIEDKLKEKP